MRGSPAFGGLGLASGEELLEQRSARRDRRVGCRIEGRRQPRVRADEVVHQGRAKRRVEQGKLRNDQGQRRIVENERRRRVPRPAAPTAPSCAAPPPTAVAVAVAAAVASVASVASTAVASTAVASTAVSPTTVAATAVSPTTVAAASASSVASDGRVGAARTVRPLASHLSLLF